MTSRTCPPHLLGSFNLLFCKTCKDLGFSVSSHTFAPERNGRLAQLGRASVLYTEGHRFKPCNVHHLLFSSDGQDAGLRIGKCGFESSLHDKNNTPVVQWKGYRPPKPVMAVRIRPGVQPSCCAPDCGSGGQRFDSCWRLRKK